MSRYIFSKNNRWYISEVFDPSDSKLQEKAAYYTLTDDVTGPYYATGTSDSVSIGVSYVPIVEPAGAQIRAGVVVSDSGALYVQPLGFDGTTPYDSDSLQSFEHLQIFNTGHDEPDYGGSGGAAMEFYKCSYVSSNSWGGYKAVFNGQYYYFQSNSIGGLTYDGSKKLPQVDKIYTANALVQVRSIFLGKSMVLYMPLTSQAARAATGQVLTYNGTIDFGEVSSHLCGIFQSGQYIQADASNESTQKTICMKMLIDDTNDWKTFLSYGSFSKTVAGNYDYSYPELYWNTGTWYSYILIFANGQLKQYLNGSLKATRTYSTSPNGILQVGGTAFRGKIYDVKVFSYALSSDQIAQEAEL